MATQMKGILGTKLGMTQVFDETRAGNARHRRQGRPVRRHRRAHAGP